MSEFNIDDDDEFAGEAAITGAITSEPGTLMSGGHVIKSGDLHPPLAEQLAEAKRTTRIDVAQTGFNPALGRLPPIETQTVSLNTVLDFVPSWTARRIPMKCIGITLPEGVEFLPPKVDSTKTSDGIELKRIGPARKAVEETDGVEKPRKVTRIKPPADALSLQDRLFYLLQPPLESWLAEQELIMPFEPFGYQYEGIAWLFSSHSALLADEMGLGKTMQTITAIRLLLRSGQARRIVLICPKPLIPNWQREFKTWAEELPIVTVEGNGQRRRMLWTMPGIPILIANYESMARDIADIPDDEQPKFDLLVLDEAQRIKNRDSRTALAARSIKRRRSWALTGTPIENRPEELAALFEFMEVIPKAACPDLRQLQKLAKKYILRRTKDVVMSDMPPRIDRDAELELTDAQEYAYRTAEKEGIIQLNELGDTISVQHVFELVLRLKQITNFDPLTGESAKLERLLADMEEIGASGGKAILFSQWTRTIDWLAPTPRVRSSTPAARKNLCRHIITLPRSSAVGLPRHRRGSIRLLPASEPERYRPVRGCRGRRGDARHWNPCNRSRGEFHGSARGRQQCAPVRRCRRDCWWSHGR